MAYRTLQEFATGSNFRIWGSISCRLTPGLKGSEFLSTCDGAQKGAPKSWNLMLKPQVGGPEALPFNSSSMGLLVLAESLETISLALDLSQIGALLMKSSVDSNG